MIVKDNCIVLKTYDFQESSKLLKVLSRERGKITLIAKGARNPKNKFAGYLQTGNVLECVFYFKESRDIQTLSEVSFLVKAYSIHTNMDKLALLLPTLEMIDQLTEEQSDSQSFFDFTLTLIDWLTQESNSVIALFPYVLVRLADLSGFLIAFDDEQFNQMETYYLNSETGNVSQKVESGLSLKLTMMQAYYLFLAIQKKTKRLRSIQIDKNELKNLIHHLDVYFKLHVDGLKERKSDQLLFDCL